MKFLSVILTFLILGMAFMPCEEESDTDCKKTELTSSPADSHDAPTDNCSAFCHCARCPLSVLVPGTQHLLVNESVLTNRNASITLILPEISFSIWQPPKV